MLIPIDAEDIQRAYELLRGELLSHDPALARIPFCVLITKVDLVPVPRKVELEAPDAWGVFQISSVTREGLPQALEALWARVAKELGDRNGGEEESFPELEEWTP